jgi:ankyrin repeat protein
MTGFEFAKLIKNAEPEELEQHCKDPEFQSMVWLNGGRTLFTSTLPSERALSLLKLFFRYGLDVEGPASDESGLGEPLYQAAQHAPREVIRFLLDSGADINRQFFRNRVSQGWTPLHAATEAKNYDNVEYLVRMGANINARSEHTHHRRQTPLHIATTQKDLKMVKLLLKLGADPAVPSPTDGGTPYQVLVKKAPMSITKKGKTVRKFPPDEVEKLLKGRRRSRLKHFDPPQTPKGTPQPLKPGLVGLLKGDRKEPPIPSVNCRDDQGQTPLHRAVKEGDLEKVKGLLEEGANPNLRDDKGLTPLSNAVWAGRLDLVTVLTEAGGNPEIIVGKVSIVRRTLDKFEMLKLFVRLGAQTRHLFWDALSGYIRGQEQQMLPVLEFLLESGTSVHAISPVSEKNEGIQGRTPLHRAAEAGKRGLVELLLKHGANPKCKLTRRRGESVGINRRVEPYWVDDGETPSELVKNGNEGKALKTLLESWEKSFPDPPSDIPTPAPEPIVDQSQQWVSRLCELAEQSLKDMSVGREEARKIGEEIADKGGLPLMKEIANKTGEQPKRYVLGFVERWWNGIAGWRS